MKMILLGAPGAGKGSQATKISAKYGIPHISTGDILRSNMKAGTELGQKAKAYVERGALVPDALIIDLMQDRLGEDDCKNGYLLDGFPRTVEQAKALAEIAEIDLVINLKASYDLIVDRISGRRMCPCGESYHTKSYQADTCAKCGEPLYQRADDRPETVQERLKVYEAQTMPLIDHYRACGNLVDVEGDGEIDDIFVNICKVLDDHA